MTNLDQAVPAGDAVASAGVNQRKHSRYLCLDGGVMRISVRPEFRGRRALLVDVSSGGIGFLMEEALPADTVLVLEVKGVGEAQPISRIARVRHSRSRPTPPDAPWLPPKPALSKVFRRLFGLQDPAPPADSWLVGCQFDRPLGEDDIRQLLNSLQPPFERGA